MIMSISKENRLESKIKFYCKYKLLIIDEIGYLPITKDEANWIYVNFLDTFFRTILFDRI